MRDTIRPVRAFFLCLLIALLCLLMGNPGCGGSTAGGGSGTSGGGEAGQTTPIMGASSRNVAQRMAARDQMLHGYSEREAQEKRKNFPTSGVKPLTDKEKQEVAHVVNDHNAMGAAYRSGEVFSMQGTVASMSDRIVIDSGSQKIGLVKTGDTKLIDWPSPYRSLKTGDRVEVSYRGAMKRGAYCWEILSMKLLSP
jgi:hypothetical protein